MFKIINGYHRISHKYGLKFFDEKYCKENLNNFLYLILSEENQSTSRKENRNTCIRINIFVLFG